MSKATDTIRFIKTLRTPKGWNAGEPFRLLAWQDRFIRSVLDSDKPIHVISCPRGSGKSSLMGALGAAIIGGPLASNNVENLIIGPQQKHGQAIFQTSRAMLEIPPSGDKLGRFGLINSGKDREIKNRETGTVLRICNSESSSIEGEGFEFALADELAFYRHPEDTFNSLVTSMGKIGGAKLLLIGTRPALADGSANIFNRLLDGERDDTQVTLYTYQGDEPLTMKAAYKANPTLRHNPILRATYKAELKQAKKDAVSESAWRSRRLNDGSGYTAADMDTSLVRLDDWIEHVERAADRLPAAEGGYYLGLDLGGTYSWTAAALYYGTGRLIGRAWIPEHPSLEARSRQDHIELPLYRKLVGDGELIVHPGNTVPPGAVLKWVVDRFGKPSGVIADKYKVDVLKQAMIDEGLRCPLVLRGNQAVDGDQDTRAFQSALLDGKVAVEQSALWRFSIGETRVRLMPSGSQAIDNSRRRAKDDLMSAACICVAHGSRNPVRARRKLRAWVGGKEVVSA